MVKHYFGDLFTLIRGVRTDFDRKPNPEVTLSVIKEFGFEPDDAVFIGDGMPDLNLSKNAGIDFIPIGYGYTKVESLFENCGIKPVQTVSELREKLLEIT